MRDREVGVRCILPRSRTFLLMRERKIEGLSCILGSENLCCKVVAKAVMQYVF
jgi:hypothetical protein